MDPFLPPDCNWLPPACKWPEHCQCPTCVATINAFAKEMVTRYHNQRLEEQLSLKKPTPGTKNPWYFVTFTLSPEHHDVPVPEIITRVLALCKSKVVKVEAFYGCQEWTKAGIPHIHLLAYVPKVGKKGFGTSHISNFWKYGNVDIKKPNGDLKTSINNLIQYIQKIEVGKLSKSFLGDYKKIQCLIDADIPVTPQGSPIDEPIEEEFPI